MPPDATFRLYVFGSPRLRINDEAVTLPPQPAAFCAFLALNRQRRITREEAQAAFWPDADPASAQQRLRRALYLLRRAVEPHADLIAAEGTELAIAPEAALWVDYEAFEQALMDAYRHDPPDRASLEVAVALYKDDLLKDIYADWALLEREHARQRFLTALRHLVGVCQRAGDWDRAIRHAHALLEHDPFQEDGHRALMTAYAATGDRSAALRQYRQCAQLLRDELGAEPLPETTQLYEAIRQGHGVAPVEAVAPVAASEPAAPDLQAIPLVGREQALAEIAAEWQTCQRGNSRLVIITGPAGVGKTRLIEEAIRRLAGANVTVITGHCYAMEAGTPYQVISDLVRDAAPHVSDRLPTALLADLAPLGRAPHDGTQATGTVAAPDASIRLQEAVTQVIRRLASSGGGLWLVAEDLHWADPASLACLNHALRRCQELPLMALATLRDEEVSFDSPIMDWPTRSVRAPAPTTLIQLSPLLPEQLHHLLAQLVEEDVGELASLLRLETMGNPFFIVETLRALIDQGTLYAEAGGHWRLRADALPEPTGLPMSDVVLRVIRGRIRRLSRAAQETLTVAAVIEHDIDERLLGQLVDPALALDLALDEVLRARVLEETAPGLYQFAHIKAREVIYADTSAPRRRFLHRRVAEALARHASEERVGDVAQLAYHYAQAREWTPALAHGWRASQTALRAGALAEANRYAERACDILDQHGSELDETALPDTLAAIRFDLLALRAEFRRRAATAGLRYPPEWIEAIGALVPQVDASRQARAALQQATHWVGRGDLDAARDAAARGRTLYAALGDRWGEFDAAQRQIDIAYGAGDAVMARRLLDDLRALSRAADRTETRQVVAQNEMRLAAYEGDWLEVLRLAQAVSSSQQARFDPAIAWLSLANLGLAYMKLGAYSQAYEVAQQAVEASQEANVLGLGARALLARLERQRGHLAQARGMLLALLETPDPLIGEAEIVAPALALARCCVAAGDIEEAKRWARRASSAVSRVRLPSLFPLSQVGWALARLAEGRYEDARKRLIYPLEWMLLLEDTSPQEIFALRAAAARGLGDDARAHEWLARANEALRRQADMITGSAYEETFLTQVALHDFIFRALSGANWQPSDILSLPV